MQATLALLALAASAVALPQGVTSSIAPSAESPSGCSSSHSGSFEITVVNVTSSSKRSLQKRQKSGILTLTLKDGVLLDQADRTGYIASNYQFQFDAPPQTGAIYTSGFSLCSNGSLALGGSSIFYQCLSGEFYNLYDRHWAAQCSPIYIEAIGVAATTPAATQGPDGQPAVTTQVSEQSDGQPAAVTQIKDGQIQGPKSQPITQISDGQPQAPKSTPAAPVSQISDGQPQAPTGKPKPTTPVAPVSQISDGQPQAPTGKPKPTTPVAPVTQISDGQLQAPTTTPTPTTPVAPVTQISDGQPQAPTTKPTPTTTASPITQISDGQIQAPTSPVAAVSTPVSPVYTGAAATAIPVQQGVMGLAVGLAGFAAML